MTPKPIYVEDYIGECVAKVNTLLLATMQAYQPAIVGINYQFGFYKEVVATLTQMTQAANGSKYPLVWLVLPVKEKHGTEIGINETDPIRIIIAHWSNPTDKAATRLAGNFKRLLIPIYVELLHQIDVSRRFLSKSADLIPHTKTNYPYWGGDNPTEASNPFNDVVDIVDIQGLELKINLKNC